MRKLVYSALASVFCANLMFATPFVGNTFDVSKIGEEKNVDELEKLATSNPYLTDVNYMLGVYYMAGDVKKGIPPDFKKAMSYLQKDRENIAIANYKIAELYYYGYGVEKDYDKAIEYFKQSTSDKYRDHKAVAPIALLAISQIYLDKLADFENAAPYLMEAAQKFDKVEAQITLAFLYHEGKGVTKNDEEADYWINRAYFNKEATGDHKAYISNFIEPSKTFDIAQDVRNYCGVLN